MTRSEVHPLLLTVVGLSAFGVTAGIAVLLVLMRGLMQLGGMVAVGGPFQIAHPAPDWVWLLPMAIVVGMVCGTLNVWAANRLHRMSLQWPAWTAVFVLGGALFLYMGLNGPGGGTVWAWVVCGVLFFGVAFLPWPYVVRQRAWDSGVPMEARQHEQAVHSVAARSFYWGVTAVALALGAGLGFWLALAMTG